MGFVHKTLAHQPIKKKCSSLLIEPPASLCPLSLFSRPHVPSGIYHIISSLSQRWVPQVWGPRAHASVRGCDVFTEYSHSFSISLSLSLSLFQWIYLSYKSAMMSVYTLYHKNNFTTKIWLFINFIHTFYIKKNFIYTIIIRVVNSINKVMRVNRLALFYCSNQPL